MITNFELSEMFGQINQGLVPGYDFQKKSKDKEGTTYGLVFLQGKESNSRLTKDHWDSFLAFLRIQHDKVNDNDFEKIDISLVHFQDGFGIFCCKNIFTALWSKSLSNQFLYKNLDMRAIAQWNLDTVIFRGLCPGDDLRKQKPNFILSKALKRNQISGKFRQAKFVEDPSLQGVLLSFQPDDKLAKNIEDMEMNFRISGGIRVFLHKYVEKGKSDKEIEVDIQKSNIKVEG